MANRVDLLSAAIVVSRAAGDDVQRRNANVRMQLNGITKVYVLISRMRARRINDPSKKRTRETFSLDASSLEKSDK